MKSAPQVVNTTIKMEIMIKGKKPVTNIKRGEIRMSKYECVCGYIYDPAKGEGDIPPGTAFEDLPEDYVCPECGLGKDAFTKME